MKLLPTEWLLLGLIGFLLLGLAFIVGCFVFNSDKATIIFSGIVVILLLGSMFGISWFNTHTAVGQRKIKDFQSNWQGGLNREITITAEDGREIFHYEGKVDIETVHEGDSNYILFEGENGERHIIYYGITDTILIIEKPEKNLQEPIDKSD